MALILYLPETGGPEEELYRMVTATAFPKKVERYKSIQELSERLHQPIFDIKVTVILAADQKELQAITSLSDFLNDMKIILVLPDREPTTIAKGHLLRPRFIAWLDDDFTHVEIFLKRMLSLYGDSFEEAAKKRSTKRLAIVK